MARTFKLVSGSDEVDLIETGSPGIIAKRGGFGPNRNQPRLTFTSSSLADSARLRLKKTLPVTKRYVLNMRGSSHDNIASQLQSLERIMRKGDLFQLTNWQQEPLYVQQQTTNETNARYSLVLAWNGDEIADLFDQPYESLNELENFEILLVREPYWRSHAPQTLSDPEPVFAPNFPYFDDEDGATENIEVIAEAAISGDWGAAFTIDGAGSEVRGFFNGTSNETEFTFEFEFDPNSLVMAGGNSFGIWSAQGSGPGGSIGNLRLNENAPYDLELVHVNDAGGAVSAGTFGIGDEPITIRIEWKASTGVGADDGYIKLYVDDSEEISATGLDTDLHDVDLFRWGAIFGVDAGTSGTMYYDTIRWDDAVPAVTWIQEADFERTEGFVGNCRQSSELTHIYMEDNNLAAFSANFVDEPIWPWFEVSGSTPAANDAAYFGADDPFFGIVFYLAVAGSGHDVVQAVEYSQGAAAWQAIDANFTNQLEDVEGNYYFQWPGASDWAKDTVNGANKYWIRFKLTTVTTWGTSPEQGDHLVYLANDVYTEFNALQIHGDVPALTMMRYNPYSMGPYNGISNEKSIAKVIGGVRSRGLTNFTSRINPGGDNPTGINISYSFDTAQQADPTAPGGNTARVSFNDTAENTRVFIELDEETVSGIRDDFEGTYRAYLRYDQLGGSNGDITVRIELEDRFVVQVGETIKLDFSHTIVDVGEFTFGGTKLLADEATGSTLSPRIILYAQSAHGSGSFLDIYDIILMPIDEMIFISSWSGNQRIETDYYLQIDSGLLREGALLGERIIDADNPGTVRTPISPWEFRSQLPLIEPRKNMQLHYLFVDDVNGRPESAQGLGFGVVSRVHERWYHLRGAN